MRKSKAEGGSVGEFTNRGGRVFYTPLAVEKYSIIFSGTSSKREVIYFCLLQRLQDSLKRALPVLIGAEVGLWSWKCT